MNNNRKNNGFAHNVLFYAIIFLCIMGIAYFFFGGRSTDTQKRFPKHFCYRIEGQ